MSDDLSGETTRLPIGWLTAGAAVLVLALLILLATLGGSHDDTVPGGPGAAANEENGLEKARQALARSGSPETCQAAIQQIRSYLGQDNVPEHTPTWDAQEKAWLVEKLGLSSDEQEEVGSSTYTALDAAHLEACLLMRDVARTLVRKEDRRAGRAGLEQAKAAFAWVMRQVRLQMSPGETLPPTYVLSRGWGTDVERGLVFLALLEQMGSLDGSRPDLLGCVLMVPDEGGKQRLWACGVVVPGGRDVYLFDPRLGLPLPGPRGEGIATLEQARSDADVLGQLSGKRKDRYDVTKTEARQARALLFCPLSSLAPRIRYLQDALLKPAVKVRLALDARQAHKELGAAVGSEVSFWQVGVRLLRRFLSSAEGGTDTPQQVLLRSLGGYTTPDDTTSIALTRKQLYQFGLVPWKQFPNELRDQQRFPYNVSLGDRVRNLFAHPFRHGVLSYDGPRQRLLRGHYDQAADELTSENDRWREAKQQRANAGNIGPHLDAWVEKAIRAHAMAVNPKSSAEQRSQAEAEVKGLWEHSEALTLLLADAIADARRPEILYLLGQCLYEKAEAKQAMGEAEEAEKAHRDALDWCNTFLTDYPRHVAAPAVRRLRAEALAALGERDAARKAFEALAGALSGLEKVAALYQAEQLRGKK